MSYTVKRGGEVRKFEMLEEAFAYLDKGDEVSADTQEEMEAILHAGVTVAEALAPTHGCKVPVSEGHKGEEWTCPDCGHVWERMF